MGKLRSVTDEELRYIKDFVLIPLVLTVFHRDIKLLETSKIRMKHIYIGAITRAADVATRELAVIKRVFFKSGIKVWLKQRDKVKITVGYLCRGYEQEFPMLWQYLRPQVELRMRYYLGEDVGEIHPSI